MKYLAYGANMDKEIMTRRCPTAELLSVGELENYRLMFKGEEPNAYATIEPWQGYKVPYVLWEISAADEARLDSWEGYPRHYQKSTVEIDYLSEKILAMYYHKPEKQRVGQPVIHYVDVLARAYERFGFDRKILDAALELSDRFFSMR